MKYEKETIVEALKNIEEEAHNYIEVDYKSDAIKAKIYEIFTEALEQEDINQIAYSGFQEDEILDKYIDIFESD